MNLIIILTLSISLAQGRSQASPVSDWITSLANVNNALTGFFSANAGLNQQLFLSAADALKTIFFPPHQSVSRSNSMLQVREPRLSVRAPESLMPQETRIPSKIPILLDIQGFSEESENHESKSQRLSEMGNVLKLTEPRVVFELPKAYAKSFRPTMAKFPGVNQKKLPVLPKVPDRITSILPQMQTYSKFPNVLEPVKHVRRPFKSNISSVKSASQVSTEILLPSRATRNVNFQGLMLPQRFLGPFQTKKFLRPREKQKFVQTVNTTQPFAREREEVPVPVEPFETPFAGTKIPNAMNALNGPIPIKYLRDHRGSDFFENHAQTLPEVKIEHQTPRVFKDLLSQSNVEDHEPPTPAETGRNETANTRKFLLLPKSP